MSAPDFTHLGKEVLLDGQHYADARDTDAAAAIAEALNLALAIDDARVAA